MLCFQAREPAGDPTGLPPRRDAISLEPECPRQTGQVILMTLLLAKPLAESKPLSLPFTPALRSFLQESTVEKKEHQNSMKFVVTCSDHHP